MKGIPWWQFFRPRPELYRAVRPSERCLVTGRVSKHVMFGFQPTDRIFNEQVYVFALSNMSSFASMQSRIHNAWTRLLSSTLGDGLRYAGSDCFETFPFPEPDPRAVIHSIETIGATVYDKRATFMVDTDQGLTKTYNALKDPTNDTARVLELRRLHEQLDRAVLDAYGWTDITVPPFCPITDADRAALTDFEDEVIDRLYVLNAERAQEEERLGLRKKKGKNPKRGKKTVSRKASKSSDSDEQGKLF